MHSEQILGRHNHSLRITSRFFPSHYFISFHSFLEDVMPIILSRKLGARPVFLKRARLPFRWAATRPDSPAVRTIKRAVWEGTPLRESSNAVLDSLSRTALPRSVASSVRSRQPLSDRFVKFGRAEIIIRATSVSVTTEEAGSDWSVSPSRLTLLKDMFFKLFAIPWWKNKNTFKYNYNKK